VVPEETYEFDDVTYERIAQAGVIALSVLDVLYGGAVVRRHIGAVLQVAGRDRAGTWLAVALIETVDDRYTVAGARRLDDAEITAIARMRGERP
jgi:hypothetical protein